MGEAIGQALFSPATLLPGCLHPYVQNCQIRFVIDGESWYLPESILQRKSIYSAVRPIRRSDRLSVIDFAKNLAQSVKFLKNLLGLALESL